MRNMEVISELNSNAYDNDDAEYGVNHLADVDPSEFLMSFAPGENHVCPLPVHHTLTAIWSLKLLEPLPASCHGLEFLS